MERIDKKKVGNEKYDELKIKQKKKIAKMPQRSNY